MSGPNILPKMKEIPDFLRKNRQDLLLYIRQSIIGDFSYIPTAFGLRPQIYAD